ncbi:MAG: GYF domain-containing protein [Dehalococcoidales bacterium]
MNDWFLYRDGQQNGPYSLNQLAEMDRSGQLFESDLFYGPSTGNWIPLAEARSRWYSQPIQQPPPHQTAPPYQQAPAKKPKAPRKKGRGCLISILVVIALLAGTAAYFVLSNPSQALNLGSRHQVAKQSVDSSGGKIVVEDKDSPINGMQIDVPAGAMDKNTNFKISTREIESHRLGGNFNPLTPLITVDNGHKFADEMMLVTIPINLPDDSFAMVFYYDEKTEKLEGLPLVSLTDNEIVVATQHFSELVATSVKKSKLEGATIDTGFMPGLDDWQFPNWGSHIAMGGHCAGQSVSAMWYYFERYLKNEDRRLFNLFDNNRYGINTKGFWQDDSWAYRFASVVQTKMDWDSKMRTFSTYVGGLDDYYTLAAFQYSMMLTGEPQYIAVAKTEIGADGKRKRVAGHAVIAYRIDGSTIYTADPNFPGASKVLNYDSGKFNTYSSALNAADLESEGAIGFNEIRYMAKSAMVDWDEMATLYNQMLKGTIGNDLYEPITYEIATDYNPITDEYKWKKCPDILETNGDKTAKVHESLRGKVVIKVESGYGNQYTSFYTGVAPVVSSSLRVRANMGSLVYQVPLKQGENHLGYLTEFGYPEGGSIDYGYSEFKRIKVIYDQKASLEFEQDEYSAFAMVESKFKALGKDVPSDTKYVWNFGDGTDLKETKKPVADHIYQEEGSYVLTLKAVSTKDGRLYAETLTTVDVINLCTTWELKYTVEESKLLDAIITAISRAITSIIDSIFGTDSDPDSINITLKGTEVTCAVVISPPLDGETDFNVVLTPLYTNREDIDVDESPWQGTMAVNNNKVTMQFEPIDEDGDSEGVITFKGKLSSSTSFAGTFSHFLMKGSFVAYIVD